MEKYFNGPVFHITNTNIIKLRVLGYEDEATRLLDEYLPNLRKALSDPRICTELSTPIPGVTLSRLDWNLEALSVAQWLSQGEFDSVLASRTLTAFQEHPDMKYAIEASSTLTRLLLIALEAEDTKCAEDQYGRWEKKPLESAPTNQRFSARANRWEKQDAVPYIDILDLARIVYQCKRLSDEPISHAELCEFVR